MTTADGLTAESEAIAAVKAYLRIDDASEDAAIGALITAAIGHGETYIGQMLIARPVAESIPVGAAWRRLTRGPVNAVSGVVGQAGTGAPFALTIDAYAIDIDAAGDGWVRIAAPGSATRATVSYVAGVATAWAGLPEPVRQGVIRLASHFYTHRDAAEEDAPPAAIAALWRPWRRMRLA